MARPSNRWALVLAAGSGTRLQSLTADSTGASIPKQFCSLNGGSSLLEEALARAAIVACPAQTIVVVAAEHRRHWQNALTALPPRNVIVQPRNRGTANGILLGVSAILSLAPEALVAILPSDHYVEREDVLAQALERAMTAIASDECAGSIGFLGIEPDSADPELGYIVRGEPRGDGTCTVARFVEKPSREVAAKLLREISISPTPTRASCARAFPLGPSPRSVSRALGPDDPGLGEVCPRSRWSAASGGVTLKTQPLGDRVHPGSDGLELT